MGDSAEVGSAAEHSAAEDLAAMDMDADLDLDVGTGVDLDMGATDTTVVTEATDMLATPSIKAISVAIIRTAGLEQNLTPIER